MKSCSLRLEKLCGAPRVFARRSKKHLREAQRLQTPAHPIRTLHKLAMSAAKSILTPPVNFNQIIF